MSDTDSTTLIAPGATRRNLIIGGAGLAAGITLPSAAALAAEPAGHKHHQTEQGRRDMGTFTTKDGTSIYYKDWGTGRPVVFSHGWPLSSDAWEDQMVFLAERGYRCIAHDRRGHGARASRGAATVAAKWRATLAATAAPVSARRCSSAPCRRSC